MQLPIVSIPAPTPVRPARQTQPDIPNDLAQRQWLWQQAKQFAKEQALVPPLSLEELRQQGGIMLRQIGGDERYLHFAAVLINNALWLADLARVPFERRLLLLPKCLRVEDTCPAPFDEFGLLCKHCGQCSLQDLQLEAERLGYAVLIAEGSALVTAIIATGKIDAIVGVSCLSVLEKAFPYMEAAAIPGVAVPLLQDDCKDTNVDLDWIWDVIHLTSDDRTWRLNLDALREQVQDCFTPTRLEELLGPTDDVTDQLARQWLAQDGKRWRPFLAACAWQALQTEAAAGETPPPLPDGLAKLLVAVECFHKASLVHDDIEDDDDERYGEPTLHAAHGLPVALNIGDYLLGLGYQLIADCGATPEQIAAMTRIAAAGHRRLCQGQGAELWWARHPQPLTTQQVLGIFAGKTAPAFEVALRLGAVLGGADDDLHAALQSFSENLGIAYQIRDDLQDWLDGDDPADVLAQRPSIVLAVAHERARPADKALTEQLWRRRGAEGIDLTHLRQRFVELEVQQRCERLLEGYKAQCGRTLADIEQASLKGLLRRVLTRIFDDLKIEGWCRESETTDASGRPAVAPVAG